MLIDIINGRFKAAECDYNLFVGNSLFLQVNRIYKPVASPVSSLNIRCDRFNWKWVRSIFFRIAEKRHRNANGQLRFETGECKYFSFLNDGLEMLGSWRSQQPQWLGDTTSIRMPA